MSTDPPPPVSPGSSAVRVELFCHPGCPHVEPTRVLLRGCLTEAGLNPTVIDRVGAYPSPTVLINGRDVMGEGGLPAGIAACRLDLPTRQRVREALPQARRAGRD